MLEIMTRVSSLFTWYIASSHIMIPAWKNKDVVTVMNNKILAKSNLWKKTGLLWLFPVVPQLETFPVNIIRLDCRGTQITRNPQCILPISFEIALWIKMRLQMGLIIWTLLFRIAWFVAKTIQLKLFIFVDKVAVRKRSYVVRFKGGYGSWSSMSSCPAVKSLLQAKSMESTSNCASW